jgi:hypothetical protein
LEALDEHLNARVLGCSGTLTDHEVAGDDCVTDFHVEVRGDLSDWQHTPPETKTHHLCEHIRLMTFSNNLGQGTDISKTALDQ